MAIKHAEIGSDNNTHSNLKGTKNPFAWPGESIKTKGSENIFKSLNKKIVWSKTSKERVTVK